MLLYLPGLKNNAQNLKNNVQNLNWYISISKKLTDLDSVTYFTNDVVLYREQNCHFPLVSDAWADD